MEDDLIFGDYSEAVQPEDLLDEDEVEEEEEERSRAPLRRDWHYSGSHGRIACGKCAPPSGLDCDGVKLEVLSDACIRELEREGEDCACDSCGSRPDDRVEDY